VISLRYSFLFVHIPKTAGNSIQNILRNYSEDEIVQLAPHQDGVERFEVRSRRYNIHKHSMLSDYYRELGPHTFHSLYKFTCIRNPWERLISFYFSPHRGDVRWNRRAFLSFLDTVSPASTYLELPDGTEGRREPFQNVDAVIRFERLDEDFRAVCERIGIPYQPLPVRNRSSRDDHRKYYDPHLVDAVGRRYRDEIAYFGYSFGEDGVYGSAVDEENYD